MKARRIAQMNVHTIDVIKRMERPGVFLDVSLTVRQGIVRWFHLFLRVELAV